MRQPALPADGPPRSIARGPAPTTVVALSGFVRNALDYFDNAAVAVHNARYAVIYLRRKNLKRFAATAAGWGPEKLASGTHIRYGFMVEN